VAVVQYTYLIHLVVCLTTGPKPLPKRALHIVRSTHTSIHTNNTQNDTKTINTRTQKLGRMWAVPRLCGFYPGIYLTIEENALGLGGIIILKCMLKKWDGRMWTGSIWFRQETSGGPS